MSEYGTHKRHCFRIVQPENEFMGCKYGEGKDCPMYKDREVNLFRVTSEVKHQWLEKRSIYSGEQYIDVKATVTGNDHFDITVTGSQHTNIKTSVSRECLETLVADLTLLLDSTKED